MKKLIVGAFIGALIIFAWQASSWMFLGIHDSAYKHVAAPDSAIAALSQIFKEEGQYMIPMAPETASDEEKQKFMEDRVGKPWAMVQYHNKLDMDMTLTLVRGFLIHFVCVWLVIVVMKRLANKSFGNIFWSTLTFGIVSWLFVWYTGHNWAGIPWGVLKGELIDCLVAWGLCGAWLGWYLK